ncbi:hypothetical protein TCAL_02713 [Tigriopus californicus]|uniref:Uncharacterized protein n=1 Tax=Tigriopus californicus TaxID=6832 RepID=A0A553PFD4_TIGCA|nr:FMRFamide neuropeptides-like [Tigriopus californicus]TRY76387.1 hypothetical protein TCAL_02713 [Tigriopus californicus]
MRRRKLINEDEDNEDQASSSCHLAPDTMYLAGRHLMSSRAHRCYRSTTTNQSDSPWLWSSSGIAFSKLSSSYLILFVVVALICPSSASGYQSPGALDYNGLPPVEEENSLNNLEEGPTYQALEELANTLANEGSEEEQEANENEPLIPWPYLLDSRPRRSHLHQDEHLLRFGKRSSSPMANYANQPLDEENVEPRNARSGNHLLRFSRSGQDHLLRFSKRNGAHLLRFNRAHDDAHMLRFGRSNTEEPDSQQYRSARAGEEHLLRFSRSGGDHLLRFSRGDKDHLLRFSRSSPDHLLRFSRTPGKMLRSVRTPELLKRFQTDVSGDGTDFNRINRMVSNDHLLRFSRSGADHLLRFSKRSADDFEDTDKDTNNLNDNDNSHLLRFARDSNDVDRAQHIGSQNRFTRQDSHLLRFA